MRKDDSVYIDHILGCIGKINTFCEGIDKHGFIGNAMLQDAVIRNVDVIGEAAKKLSPEFRKTHDHIPWKEISGMRDKLIHNYFGVDIEIVWKTVQKDIPYLESLIKGIKGT